MILSVGSYFVLVDLPVVAQITVSNTSSTTSSDIEGFLFTVQVAAGSGTTPKITPGSEDAYGAADGGCRHIMSHFNDEVMADRL